MNERFYPAIERKNDFIVKGVKQVQLDKAIDHTTKKTVLKGKVLVGLRCYDGYDAEVPQRGYHTIIEHIYK